MIGRSLRVLIGFVIACLGAGVTLVLFVTTPLEMLALPAEVMRDRAGKAGELALHVSVQAALFAAPFGLLAAAMGEVTRNRRWGYYAFAGLVIAGLGFLAQHSMETAGQPTLVNAYAIAAFLASGLVAGSLYWLTAGRRAGGRKSTILPGPGHTVPDGPTTH